MVDNVEDLDLVVGFHAETTRPHGFAISETQFHIFILNASRRLFSDRFLTSSFRPEFYTKLGIDWVMDNGPTGKQWEEGEPNGHKQRGLAAEAGPAAHHPGAGTGAEDCRQRLRSLGEGSRPVLFDRLGGASGREG